MYKKNFIIGLLLVLFTIQAHATVITGTILDWDESGPIVTIGDGSNHVSLWWSINTTNRGWFYGSSSTVDSDVALATGVSDISQIVDASLLTYATTFIDPPSLCDADCAANGVGDFVVWQHIITGHYGVLRIDDIHNTDTDVSDAKLNGTWWFQTDGSANFSGTVPEPATLALFGLGLAGMGFARRKKKSA